MKKYRYQVRDVEMITPTIVLVTLQSVVGEQMMNFLPGQYAAINFYRDGRPTPSRSFSIVSSPTERGKLQFAMRVGGKYTGAAAKMNPGEIVDVIGPFGDFVLRPARDREIVFLAGGIGVTPAISMARYLSAINLTIKMRLILSTSSQDDVPFLNELEDLRDNNRNFAFTLAISRGEIDILDGLDVVKGRISAEVVDRISGSARPTYFICGPASFMDSMRDLLIKRAVPAEKIVSEAFAIQGHPNGLKHDWPSVIYTLTTAGIAVATVLIMIADIAKTAVASSSQAPSATILPINTPTSTSKVATAINSYSGSDSATTSTPAPVTALPTVEPTASPTAQPLFYYQPPTSRVS